MNNKSCLSKEDIDAKVRHLFAHKFNHTLHAYIDIAGDLVAGTLLSQIMYWFAEGKNGKTRATIYRDGHYWIAKRREDWMDEIRISQKQYDCAIRKLAKIEPKKQNEKTDSKKKNEKEKECKEFLEVKVFHFNGIPTTHIRPITENINKALDEWKENLVRQILEENSEGCNGNSPNGNMENIDYQNDETESSNFTNGEDVSLPNGNMEIPQTVKSYNIYNNTNTSAEITPETTFRDYNNVSCDSQDIYIPDSDENIDMYAGFPKQENPETEKKSRFIPVDYTEEQLAEHVKPVYRKVIDGYYGRIGDGAEEDAETLTKITIYFHRKFREKYHSRCRILSDKAYIRIAENFCEPPICMEGVYDFDRYAEMIDRYIKTELNKSGNYEREVIPSLAHFMSDAIRENLYRKTDY